MFPKRHKLNDSDIARALGILHQECANIAGQDVAELYHFLKTNPDLHTNGIRLWQGIKASRGKEKEDEAKVAHAIGRFTNVIPAAKR